MIPWWANAAAGTACFLLAINFFAQAYGLRLGGKPLDTTALKKYEHRPQDGPLPPAPDWK